MFGKLNSNEIEELIHRQFIGRLGCHAEDVTYIVPISYAYDGEYIYGHTYEGMKVSMMRKNPKICFEVDEMKTLRNWKSVIVWGEYQELTDERDRYAALKLFVDRTMHMKISETAVPPESTEQRVHPRSPGNIKPVVYRIVIEEITGRYEKE